MADKPQKKTETAGGGRPPVWTRVGADEGGSEPQHSSFNFWRSYMKILREAFSEISPPQRQELMGKLKVFVFGGITLTLIILTFPNVPWLGRVFIFPVAALTLFFGFVLVVLKSLAAPAK